MVLENEMQAEIVPEEKHHYFSEKPRGVPEGRYRLVGWSVDTTGRRLIDEICQLAAYTPTSQFSQYIMPFADLNPPYRKRHNIKVVTVGRYRMLKDIKGNKVIKTRSEISALIDFLAWLEQNRGGASDGIVLIYHEARKTSPALLLEALRRYNLSERFANVVKGFANCFNLAEAKCANTTKSFSLRTLSKVLLDKEFDFGNATDRARTCYEIAVHLGQSEVENLESNTTTNGGGDCSGIEQHLNELVRPYGNPVSAEEDEIAKFKVILERQNTYRPIFGALLRATRPERLHASYLRRLLAENNIEFNKLKEAWENGKKGEVQDVLQKEIPRPNEKDIDELVEILDCFFDPEKKPIEPKPRLLREPSLKNRKHKEHNDSNNNKNNNNNVSTESVEKTATLLGMLTLCDSATTDTTPRSNYSDEQAAVH